jgi:hypothetical protein
MITGSYTKIEFVIPVVVPVRHFGTAQNDDCCDNLKKQLATEITEKNGCNVISMYLLKLWKSLSLSVNSVA